MARRIAATALLGLVAAAPALSDLAKPPSADVYVAIVTDRGRIVVDLDAAHAPITTANFLRYADQKRFDGTSFYRAMHLEWGTQPAGLVQGGAANDPKRVLAPIAHEPTSVTGIRHTAGAISMARLAPGTATGDFFILLADLPGLDADPRAADVDAGAGFAAFGHVVAGMDVVRAIWDAPRSATKGVGVMQGQMIEAPVRIVSVRRTVTPVVLPAPLASDAAVPAPAASGAT